MAAVAVVTWIGISVAKGYGASNFGVYLPLWFTVQYVGHVAAYFGGRLAGAEVTAQSQPAVVAIEALSVESAV